MTRFDRHLYVTQLQYLVERNALADELGEKISAALETLDPRLQKIVRRVFGLGKKPQNLSQIARSLGKSPQRIQQLLAKALRKLRQDSRKEIWGEMYRGHECVPVDPVLDKPSPPRRRPWRRRENYPPAYPVLAPEPNPWNFYPVEGMMRTPEGVPLAMSDWVYWKHLMDQVHDLKDVYCVHCKIAFPKRMTMANGHGGQLHKGMIMLCSACGGAQILGDTTWRPMLKADFDALPHQSKIQLVTTANALRARLGAGKEWSPYEQQPLGN